MSPDSRLDPQHLLLIGAGPGVGAAVARRFGREEFRATLISRGDSLDEVAAGLRDEGMSVSQLVSDVEALDDGYRATLRALYETPDAPAVLVYNASLLVPDGILTSTVEHLREAYDVDVIGAVVAAQIAAPVLRAAHSGTILFTGGGFADYPAPALATISMGKAALRAAATLVAAEVGGDGVHAASVTIAGQVAPETAFDPNNIAEIFWTAYTHAPDEWLAEYRFEPTEEQTQNATSAVSFAHDEDASRAS
jgi:NAD(P)-dependent dehydrogenase (short-subunit alcohol dehydrogenase family)